MRTLLLSQAHRAVYKSMYEPVYRTASWVPLMSSIVYVDRFTLM